MRTDINIPLVTCAHNYIKEHNESAYLPYHNNKHMTSMSLIAGKIYLSKSADFEIKDFVSLKIACLFHDFNHTGGKEKDSVNIGLALEAFNTFYENIVVGHSESQFLDKDVVSDIIRCTEYPFIHTPETFLQQCARDADLLYATMSADPTIIMEGIRPELEVATGIKIGLRQMYNAQVDFLGAAVMYTERGNKLMSEHKDQYLKLLDNYVRINEAKTN